MSLTTASLIILSGFTQSLWNLLSKKAINVQIFFALTRILITVIFFPYFILKIISLPELSTPLIKMIISSGTLSFLAYAFTAKSYKTTSLSIAYPIVRLSVLFVPILAYIFLNEKVNLIGVIGITITIFGIFLLNGSENTGNKNWLGISYALLAAFFLALQSILDKYTIQKIDPGIYFYLYSSVCSIYYLVFIFVFADKSKIKFEIKTNFFLMLIVTLLHFFSFIVFLYAVQKSNLSYSVAIRQIGIVFTSFFSWFFLKEIMTTRKVIATLTLTLGVLIVILN